MTLKMLGRRLPTLVLFTALTAIAAPQPAEARTLDEAMTRFAVSIAAYLQDRGEDSLVVGPFRDDREGLPGSKMRKLLVEKLTERKVRVKLATGMQVTGEFSRRADGDRTLVHLTINMKDRLGVVAGSFSDNFESEQDVDNPEDVATLIGATFDGTTAAEKSPEEATTREPAAAVTAAVATPAFHAEGSRVSPKSGSPFQMEILVRNGETYTPVAPEAVDGTALVDLQVGQEYAVRLYNNLEFDVGVRLSIDGLNLFEFSEAPLDAEGKPAYRKLGFVVIPAGSSGMIKGWHRTDERSNAFLITELPDSAAAKISAETSRIGTINAAYFVAWSPGETPPSLELVGSKSKGTAIGQPIDAQYTSVRRFFGKTLLASVTVRYNRPRPGDLPE